MITIGFQKWGEEGLNVTSYVGKENKRDLWLETEVEVGGGDGMLWSNQWEGSKGFYVS